MTPDSFSLSGIDFDPRVTFESGQTFRWKRLTQEQDAVWLGVISGHVVVVSKDIIKVLASSSTPEESVETSDFSNICREYFSVRDDLGAIIHSFPKDEYLSKAVRQFGGLRILTQDPWECMISFLCSINKNIPAIRDMIERLSSRFGNKIVSIEGLPVFSFPTASRLAHASKEQLLDCKVGFRWRFIKSAARHVDSGKIDLETLRRLSYEDARIALVNALSGPVIGIGPKVADCIQLFGFHKLEAFPIDVWMIRCLSSVYGLKLGLNELRGPKTSLSLGMYETLHKLLHEYFGRYSGYAQQYLYMKIRADSIRNRVQV